MSDPTTEGFQATPAEIEGMVRNLCAYALGEPDPVQRYLGLTQQQVLFEGMVEAIRRERGRVLADLVVGGVAAEKLAESTSLGTVVKVRKLISLAGETERVQEAATARKEAERQAAAAQKAAEKAAVEEAAMARKEAERKAAKAQKAAAKQTAGPDERQPEPPRLPPHLAAPAGKRLLTAADRLALGLPAEEPAAKQAGKPKRDKKTAKKTKRSVGPAA